jgi:hypothetical protein
MRCELQMLGRGKKQVFGFKDNFILYPITGSKSGDTFYRFVQVRCRNMQQRSIAWVSGTMKLPCIIAFSNISFRSCILCMGMLPFTDFFLMISTPFFQYMMFFIAL